MSKIIISVSFRPKGVTIDIKSTKIQEHPRKWEIRHTCHFMSINDKKIPKVILIEFLV